MKTKPNIGDIVKVWIPPQYRAGFNMLRPYSGGFFRVVWVGPTLGTENEIHLANAAGQIIGGQSGIPFGFLRALVEPADMAEVETFRAYEALYKVRRGESVRFQGIFFDGPNANEADTDAAEYEILKIINEIGKKGWK